MRTLRVLAAAALVLALMPVLSAAELPRRAPDYVINLPGGKSVALSQYRGKVVVMTFILTACSHCQATVKVLNEMQNEYGPRGLQVLVSAINSDAPGLVPLFIKNFNPPYPVGYSDGGSAEFFIQPVSKLAQMPLMAFIDRNGIIRAQAEGEQSFFSDLDKNLRKQIETLLKMGAPPAKK